MPRPVLHAVNQTMSGSGIIRHRGEPEAANEIWDRTGEKVGTKLYLMLGSAMGPLIESSFLLHIFILLRSRSHKWIRSNSPTATRKKHNKLIIAEILEELSPLIFQSPHTLLSSKTILPRRRVVHTNRCCRSTRLRVLA